MRHAQLHDALRSCALATAHLLSERVGAGEEVPYELVEHRRADRRSGRDRSPVLYSYRPLVGLYLERHAALLRADPSFREATHAMAAAWGVEAYLEARGVALAPADPHERARIAVRQFLERVFEEHPTFVVDDERCTAALAEVDAVLTAGAGEVVALAPLSGVRLEGETVALGAGIALQAPETLAGEAAPEALLGPDGAYADVVLSVRWEGSPADPSTGDRARRAVERVLLALRLHGGAVSPAAGPLLWTRAGGGPWRAHTLGGTHAARGVLLIADEDVADLQTFLGLLARRRPVGDAIGWALRRWVLGLDRTDPAEALTDHLLAARALLEPEGPASGRVCGRLAALCAAGADRAATTARMARACAAERALREGRAVAPEALAALSDELADHVRAILRDVVCGHLDHDLCALADDLLADAIRERGADAELDDAWWAGAPTVRRGTAPDPAALDADAEGAAAVGLAPHDDEPAPTDAIADDVDAADAAVDLEEAQAAPDLGPAEGAVRRPAELDWSATGWLEAQEATGLVPGQPIPQAPADAGLDDWGFDFEEVGAGRGGAAGPA